MFVEREEQTKSGQVSSDLGAPNQPALGIAITPALGAVIFSS